MTSFGKIIVTIIILCIAGAVGLAYAMRPIAAPSGNAVNTEAGSADSAVTTDVSGGNSTSVATSTSAGSVASYRIAAGTRAEFNIGEVLRGVDFMVVGTTSDVAGSVQVDLANPQDSVIGTIKINARTFKTDSANRDNAIARFILKSEEPANEFITFEAKEISGLPVDAAEKAAKGEAVAFKVKGDLTITGITKSVTFDAKFSMSPGASGQIKGTAEAKIRRSDFKLVIPNVPFVANVSDGFLIKINAVLSK